MVGSKTETNIRTSSVREPVTFSIKPDADDRKALATTLGIPAIKKLTFEGEIRPAGAHDITLSGTLGATVVQDCVVTGDPVTTRIDDAVVRHYLRDMPEPELSEMEMPEDENADPLPDTLDVSGVMEEALALALPDWPRAPGVAPLDMSITEPGKSPMTDEDAKPFAALKNLRKSQEPEG